MPPRQSARRAAGARAARRARAGCSSSLFSSRSKSVNASAVAPARRRWRQSGAQGCTRGAGLRTGKAADDARSDAPHFLDVGLDDFRPPGHLAVPNHHNLRKRCGTTPQQPRQRRSARPAAARAASKKHAERARRRRCSAGAARGRAPRRMARDPAARCTRDAPGRPFARTAPWWRSCRCGARGPSSRKRRPWYGRRAWPTRPQPPCRRQRSAPGRQRRRAPSAASRHRCVRGRSGARLAALPVQSGARPGGPS